MEELGLDRYTYMIEKNFKHHTMRQIILQSTLHNTQVYLGDSYTYMLEVAIPLIGIVGDTFQNIQVKFIIYGRRIRIRKMYVTIQDIFFKTFFLDRCQI